MTQVLLLLSMLAGGDDVIVLKSFEAPKGDDFLSFPVAMCFAPEGRLFLADVGKMRIHIWEADGTYVKAFGRQGEGPGEFINPFQMVATSEAVYVWEDRRRMSVFDHDGKFLQSFHTNDARPRVFGVLKPDLFLLGHKRETEEGPAMVVTLRNGMGESLQELLSENNNGFITQGEGNNNAYLKAYLPELDIHQGPGVIWYYGFSQSKTLYGIDDDGKRVFEKTFELPTEKPSDLDREAFGSMSFPSPDGGRIAVKDLPNIRITYEFPKAYYTHFLIKGEHIAFVLTPIGSTDGTNTGYARATYYVNDFASGKLLSRGSYAFPEDSVVYYKNGRILACVLNEDDDFEVREVTLRGL